MASSLESLIYTTVGTASIAAGKFKELLEDLMQNNAYTQDEGRRIINGLLRELEDTRDNINNRIYTIVDDTLLKLNLPSQEQLQKRVDKIKADISNHPITKATKKKKATAVAIKH